MKLTKITFTGADNTTRPADLAAISREYPFVEWGFLLSTKRTGGVDSRYPTLSCLEAFGGMEMQKAVHLCGTLAQDFAEDRNYRYPIETALQVVRGVSRVQINLGESINRYPSLFINSQGFTSRLHVQIILQSYSFNTTTVQRAKDWPNRDEPAVTFLHDASGGRGIVGPFDKPVNDDLVGFAGGIGPHNVVRRIEEIYALGGKNDFWIDMETSVRTGENFDLDKVRQVIEAAAPYVGKEG